MNPLPISPAEGPGVAFTPCARYPDPAVEVLHDSFLALRLYSAQVEQLTALPSKSSTVSSLSSMDASGGLGYGP